MTLHDTTLDQQDHERERRAAWTVWAVLVGVTLAGWVLADSTDRGKAIVVLIVLLGIGKCWLIVRYYMETRHAPRWLQVLTNGWIAVLWLTLLLIFLWQ